MHPLPNFTEDQFKELNREVQSLVTALKTKKGDRSNPLTEKIDEVLASHREKILESPVFYQALFLAAALGHEYTMGLLKQLTENMKED